MKKVIQTSLLVFMGLTLFISCNEDERLPTLKLYDTEYFYYVSEDSKIYLQQSLSEIWIVFEQDTVTKESAESILSIYSSLDLNVITNNYNQIKVRINENVSDCRIVNNYLKELNENIDVKSATPVFYLSENDPESYYILLSEVLTKNNESRISESDFIDYAETMNLELVEAKYSTQYFEVKEVKTGFEALEIANQIFETGQVEYSHPNCIMKIELY